MPDEFTEEVVAPGKSDDSGNARGWSQGKGPIEEDMDLGGGGSFSVRSSARADETHAESGTDRVLPASVEARIAAMEKAAAEKRAAENTWGEEAPAGEGETTEEGQPTEEVLDGKTAAPDAAKAKPADVATDERYTRLETANKALAAELAELRAALDKPRDVPAIHKLLAEASENYIDDVPGAIRRVIAASMGIEDLNDKRIDDELRDAYADLTAHVIGVTPEPQHLAKREAARARALLAREKRERTAEKETAAERAKAEAEAHKAQQAASFIGNRIQAKRSDGRSLADDYPLLMALAEDLDGMKPESVIWKAFQHEAKTGRIAITGDDDADIAAAMKIVETRYQALRDKVAKATTPSTQPSTAQPNGAKTPPAANAETGKDARQAHGARTLTTADRSVAPAAPPAKKPAQKSEKPKFKTKEEAQRWALRHIPE